MTLKNSLLHNFRSRLWLLAISILTNVFFVFVPYFMAQTQFYQDRSAGIIVGGTRMDYISEFFISGYGYFVGYAALFMAVLIAVTGFHYLHTRKGADQIHSLPVKRSHFFFVIYTNGLLIWFLPLLLSSIVVLVLGFSVIGSASAIALAVVKGLLSAAFMFLVVYHFALVCMMISGNLLNTFFAMGVLGVGIAAAYFLVYLLFGEYLYSFYAFSFSSDMIMWLSPIVSAIYILMMPEADGYQFGILLSSALFMVFHLYLAWKWYVKRKSELAGAGIENRWMQRLLRSLVTFLAGLAGALFFRLLLFQGDTKITGLTIFGCLLGAVLSYGIANMIFAMSFRAFLQHKAQMVVCCGATLVVFLCIAGGWFGYNSWLPDEEDIQSATFYVDSYHDNSFRYYQDASGMVVRGPSNMILQNGDPTYQPIRKTDAFDSQYGNMHYTDVSSIHLAMESLIQKALPSRYYSADNSFPFLGEIQTDSMVDVNVKITLKSGIDIFRTFVIEGMDYENLWPIVDSPEYRYHFFRQSENQLGTPSISSITDLEGNTYHIESRADIQALMEAYTKDFESHYKQEELFTDIAVGSFEAQYVRKTGLYYHGLSLPDTYENTLAMFREVLPAAKLSWEDLGIQAVNLSLGSVLNDQSLDTVRSWYGLNGREEMEKTMDALEAVWVDKTSQMDYETVQNIQPKYQLTVTDPALLEELSQFLHVGYLDIRSGTKLTYLSVGTAYQDQDIAKSSVAQVDYYVDYSSTMQQLGYPVYVKLGELPPEWIERIMAGE